jgi:2-keto-4-pentenoate hydratase
MTDLARRLWEARRSGGVVQPDGVSLPRSNEEAYAVQQEIAAMSGEQTVGFKVGSTSLAAQQLLGTREPAWGLLLAPYLLASPARISVDPAHTPAVEGEFAFKLGSDLPARAASYAIDEVGDAVAAVAGAIEVVGSRFSGGLAGKGRWLVTADGGANIALVTGTWCRDLKSLDLRSHPVTMTVNGALRGTGTGDCALGDPINVLVWLANQLSAQGHGLKAGEIVSTGTCTGLDPVLPGDSVCADFGGLGTIEIVFAPSTIAQA